jgi:Flp pilus assembly protein TadD
MNDHSTIDPLQQAINLQNAGNIEEAKRIFMRLYAVDPKNVAAIYSLAVIHFNNGDAKKPLSISRLRSI